jgi:hypothetical protein
MIRIGEINISLGKNIYFYMRKGNNQMKYLTATMLILFVSLFSEAQTINSLSEFYRQFQAARYQQGLNNPEFPILGSPHEKDEFIEGTVATRSDVRYENVPLRFNIHENAVEFMTDEGNIFFLEAPEVVDYVQIGEDKYVYVPYSFGNRMLRGFFRVAIEGHATLLVRQLVNLKAPEPPAPYKDAQPARFIRLVDEYYLRVGTAEAQKISNRKELLQMMKDNGTAVDDFLKKNKTRFNRLEDLIKVTEYFNSLY